MSQAQDKTAEWKKHLCFQTPTFVAHEIKGLGKLKFYPVSVGLLFKLRRLGTDIISAMSLAFANTDKDQKTIEKTITNVLKPEEIKNGMGESYIDRTVTVEPISNETAQYRDDQKSRAWSKAFDAIMKEENIDVIGEIIMDSLHEVFPRDPLTGEFKEKVSPKEFLAELKLPMITGLFMGVGLANADVLGPLAGKAKSLLDLAEKSLSDKLAPTPSQVVEVPPQP